MNLTINPEIKQALTKFNIDRDKGLSALLGIYFGININNTTDPLVIRQINISKIVVKDYPNRGEIKWNIPLFLGVENEGFEWVIDWTAMFIRINNDRADGATMNTKRMKEWFSKFPQFRKDDVMKATQNYLNTVKNPQYLTRSAKFIFEGNGANKDSQLLTWCEKLKQLGSNTNMKGEVL